MSYKFTTVITQEGKWFVARCLELGVVTQGKTVEEAQENLKEAAEFYLEEQPQPSKFFLKKAPLVTTLELEHV